MARGPASAPPGVPAAPRPDAGDRRGPREGSYLLELDAPSGGRVRYPVEIDRRRHWRHIPPEADEPQKLDLSAARAPENGIVVPAGWFQCGHRQGDHVRALPNRRLWLDSFIIIRDPVTHADYLEYLNALVEEGRDDEAEHRVPRLRRAVLGDESRRAYERDDDGRFVLPSDRGYRWSASHPVFGVRWEDARAYARWFSERQGREWRLPTEFEWEKAVRGVDGRVFLRRDHLDPNWCRMNQSTPGEPRPVAVEVCGADESPCGVRGMAGNVAEWCLDSFERSVELDDGTRPPEAEDCGESADLRVVRGGHWNAGRDECATHRRRGRRGDTRLPTMGFRLVSEVES